MRNPSNPPVNVKYLGCTAKGLDGLTVVSHARDKFLHPHLWNLRSGPALSDFLSGELPVTS